jgi:iron(III) transport system substrate-binding protein
MKMKRNRIWLAVLSVALTVSCLAPLASGAGKLVVYSAAVKSTSDLVVEMWNKQYPDITIEIISAGTGELATRIRTESVKPRADIMFTGGTETIDGMLDLIQPYQSVNDAAFKPEFKHPKHYYYAFSLPLQVFIINTSRLKESEAPQTWKELGDAKWKGQMIMANPAVSGSGYAQLNIMLQLYGWDLVKKVVNNATITSSSKLSYQGVANGEYAIGLTGESNVYNLIEEGYPVKAIYPKDGTALRYDTVTIIKNGPNPANAKKFIDFITSKPVMTAIANSEGRRMGRGDVPVKKGLIPTNDIKFMAYDEKLAGDKKQEYLAQFDDIFAAKAK